MSTEQGQLIENVNKTRRCDWCGELKPLEEFGRKQTDSEGKNTTCTVCSQRRQNAYQWRKKQEYKNISSRTYEIIQWLLGLRGQRMCQLCYEIKLADTFRRRDECPACEDKWYSPIRTKKTSDNGEVARLTQEVGALKDLVIEVMKGLQQAK